LHELEDIHREEYDNSVIYKGKAKTFHDVKLSGKEYQVGKKASLFNEIETLS